MVTIDKKTNYDVQDNDEDDNDYDVEDDDNDETGKICLFHISTVCLHISHSLNVSKTKIEILLKNKFFFDPNLGIHWSQFHIFRPLQHLCLIFEPPIQMAFLAGHFPRVRA